MSTLGPLGGAESPTPSKEEFQYEINMAVYNKKTGKWEAALDAVGKKTSSFIEDAQIRNLFANKHTGDVVEITEDGIYRKTDKGWVKEMTAEEVKKQFPQLFNSLKKLSLMNAMLLDNPIKKPAGPSEVSPTFLKATENTLLRTNGVVQILVVHTREDLKPLTQQLKKKYPVLAHHVIERDAELNKLQDEYRGLIKQDVIDPNIYKNLLRKLETSERTLKQLVTACNAALVSDKRLEEIKKAPPTPPSVIGKGKAKIVYVRPGSPEYAYFTPVTGVMESLTGSKTREIRREVQTAKKIAYHLYQADLLKSLKNKKVQNAEVLAGKLSAKSSSFQELIKAMDPDRIFEFARTFGITPIEAATVYSLKDEMLAEVSKPGYLAVNLEEVTGAEEIEGKYTVKVERAARDLEHEIQRKDVSFTDRLGLVSDLWKGMEQLHAAKHLHGDLKPENLLVYEKLDESTGLLQKHAKLSDFGKTRQLTTEKKVLYTGNPRFSSPEKQLSQEAEVYSSALIAIRILEEAFLDKERTMLLTPLIKDVIPPSKERRGVEQFVVSDGKMPQTESTLSGKVRAYGPALVSSPKYPLQEAEIEIHAYIDVLTGEVESKDQMSPNKAHRLNTLLKDMTKTDPMARPSMDEVNARFNNILASQGK
jgi:serine/threonine protein kinase